MAWPPREMTGPRPDASSVVTMMLLSLYQTLGATRGTEAAIESPAPPRVEA
ncbi:hypothetical protein [Corallococcus exiguus]|uniref:Uncharacterized protein n=1 Tax=Corallococcus exiguus TaxID=83462 RepID=A0A7X4Y9C0_9BACT|nr:hypothetical protein [Corallococcus exiguus]NBC41315.1 hypothetical protein [Corallococcus exiguus]